MFYVVKKTMFADGNDSLKEEVFVASTFQVAQQKADQLNNNWCTSSQAPSAFKPHEQCFDVITYSVQEDKY